MASVASQLIEKVTAHAQSDSLEDAREICADGFCFPNILRTLAAGLQANSHYSEGPATGHFGTGSSRFPCVCKRMLRWFPKFQVATAYFSFTRGADKSSARRGRKQTRKHVRDAREFNNIETRVVKVFFPARQGAEGNSRHSDRNISFFPSWWGEGLISNPVALPT